MEVRVLFFGVLRELAGSSADRLTVSDRALLGDVLAHYEKQIPQLKDLLPSIAMSVNREYAGPEARLHPDDEIALLPPVSGGAGKASIVRDRIRTEQVVERIQQPDDGAVVIFDGIVRNNTRGRRTRYLDYQAYEEMALDELNGVAERAMAEFGIRDVAIVHRLGRLEIGETSVLIVVASAHRGPAFEACRWIIDTLKRRVPIWKKEYFDDGAVWADGEPFPAEVPRAEGSHSGRSASK
jgi:molybdopterin synthase catalytic subunit